MVANNAQAKTRVYCILNYSIIHMFAALLSNKGQMGASLWLYMERAFVWLLVLTSKYHYFIFHPCMKMCQRDISGLYYNCGLNSTWTVYSINPQSFSITYTYGIS